jgi:hypothetical protein
MKTPKLKALALFGCGAVAATTAMLAVRARAAGIPDADPLTYTGYLEDGDGAPLTGAHSIDVTFWGSVDGTDDLCSGGNDNAELTAGRFQIPLPDCAEAVKATPDVWVDVQVDGASLGRTKLGALPYALEAGRASDSTGVLEARLAALEARVGTRSGVRVTMGATQSVPENTTTKVNFNTETGDVNDEFDPATATFKPKAAGLYLLTCSIRYEPTVGGPGTNGWWSVAVQVAGTTVAQDGGYGDGWTAFRNATTAINLSAGQAVTCNANHQVSGGVNKWVDSGGSRFEITRLDSVD